ncbi:GntP family permease [Actinomycetospora soli]|uniref:GntP family permease n=1 Tax=Actinomycetospora soli TaxID=2893887 RepID=UPI001E41FD52|nr:SLC13 family permease [Actinomycetospora soli]MCD2187372.1 GntP family permease [Actinomycetospora soli]
MPGWYLVTVTAVVVLLAVLLIVRLRVHPAVVLALAATAVGLATGQGPVGTVEALTDGFGDILAEAGLLIAFGVLIGSLLRAMGAIERLVATLLRWFGPRRMPQTMAVACATVLQPIFVDVLLVIAAPLARRIAARIGPGGVPRMAAALAIGCECGIVMMVPGIGTVAIAGVLGVPLGRMLLFGVLVLVPTVIVATAVTGALLSRWWDPARDEPPAVEPPAVDHPAVEQPGPAPATATEAAPVVGKTSLPVMLAPLLGALLLIAAGAVAEVAGLGHPVLAVVSAPPIALLLGVLGTMVVARRVLGREGSEEPLAEGFRESGLILVLTGVGGSLAEAISRSGLGDVLGGLFSANTALPLATVWLTAAVLHVAVGSVTISAITAAGILAPVAPAIGLDPVLVALAAGSGALFAVHVTSNTFWLLQSLLGQSVRGALKTCSLGVSIASVVGLGFTLALGQVL